MIVSDNGTEFTSNAILSWAKDHGVEWHYIAPGKPMQNGYIESFNGRMRDELLNESLFFDLDQARQVIGAWVADYNGETAFFARIQDAGSLCRTSHRAEGRINSRGSNRHWMKVQWQVIRPKMVGPNC
jgi:putative transposase